MKKIGCTCDYLALRDAELYRAFRQAMGAVATKDMERVYLLTADSPSSRFWTSEQRAGDVISMMLKGGSISHMTPRRQEMYRELLSRFLRRRAEFPKEKVWETLCAVVNSPAPSFYLTPHSVRITVARYHARMLREKAENSKEKEGGQR